MPIYMCPRCRYCTKIKTHLKTHFKRKNPCKPIYNNISLEECMIEIKKINNKSKSLLISNESKEQTINSSSSSSKYITKSNNDIICPTCNKVFTRIDNMKRHFKTCKGPIISNKTNSSKHIYTKSEVETLVETMNSEYDRKEQITATIILELRNQINLLMQNQGSKITYNTNIMLNAFGKENTNYIDNKLIDEIVAKGPLNSISLLLRHIHFNPDHSENHNIMIPNKKSAFAKIFNGQAWQISDKKQTIDDMTDKAYAMINEHYIKDNPYMDTFKDKYDTKDSSVEKKIKRNTEIMILNNQKPNI